MAKREGSVTKPALQKRFFMDAMVIELLPFGLGGAWVLGGPGIQSRA